MKSGLRGVLFEQCKAADRDKRFDRIGKKRCENILQMTSLRSRQKIG
jgi:hypothetical protein